ncbi:MAG: hypothetical protein B7733_18045 [Myxococcales bacterium FL481]|nr:MAG: hypothetical protein B7733_18045 [Myxococcales bacterium FL481]
MTTRGLREASGSRPVEAVTGRWIEMGLGPAHKRCYSSGRSELDLIVRCENCQTEFALDGSQITSDGVTVRCSVCAHVFRVAPPQGSAADQPWQIRTVENRLFTAVDLAMLYQWVKEGRLHPDDEVSRTGHAWLKLGEIPEFSRLFTDFAGLPAVFRKVEAPDTTDVQSGVFAPPSPASPDLVLAPEDPGGRLTQPWGTPVTPPPQDRVIADRGGPGGDSMLGAATRHASGNSAAAAVSSVDEPPGEDAAGSGSPAELAASIPVSPLPAATGDGPLSESPVFADMDPRAESRTGFPRVAAFFGAFTGVVAVAAAGVGIAYALGVRLPQAEPMPSAEREPAELSDRVRGQLERAQAVRDKLSRSEMEAADMALQRALDAGGLSPTERASLAVAHADLLATRALGSRLTRALGQSRGLSDEDLEKLAEQADADATRARAALTGAVADVPEHIDIAAVRGRVRLAEGRDPAKVRQLLGAKPPSAEVQVLIEAAALWRTSPADSAPTEGETEAPPVPPSLEESLQRLSPPTGLSRALLALARERKQDELGAATAIRAAVATASDHPLARFAEVDASTGAETSSSDQRKPRKAAATRSSTARHDASSSGAAVDRLLDQGCSAVENHRPGDAVGPLRQALERAPRNIDGLVCLAAAYAAMSNLQSAQVYYKRALAISPRHRTALAGAGRVADRMGIVDQALRYYRRLLTIDSSHVAARRYVDEHRGAASSRPSSASETAAPAKPAVTPERPSTTVPQGAVAPTSGEPTGVQATRPTQRPTRPKPQASSGEPSAAPPPNGAR